MYSETVTEAMIWEATRRSGFGLHRYPIDECQERRESLEALLQADGSLKRALKQDESHFIANEYLMSKLDFHYFAPRYGAIIRDGVEGGGLGHLNLWESQKILMNLIAKAELEGWEAAKRGDTQDGMLLCSHKARQVGHTALGRVLVLHRMLFWKHTRATSASVDDEKVMELYTKDKLLYDNLPFYIKPPLKFEEKKTHIQFGLTESFQLYQQSTKQSSLGQGRQFDIAHLTELSEYVNPLAVELDFFPTLPQSWKTLCVLESRANGRGNWWHEFSERCRKGNSARWKYCFVPWYAEPKKYRRTPPVDWTPKETSMLHAKKVYETSAEFVGKSVYLSREQLHWWETTRAEYQEANTLNFFLTNWCATPEESFQHSNQSAFSTEFLEKARLSVSTADLHPYEIILGVN